METGGEFLKVDPVTHDADGNKLEPEERPATEIQKTPIDVALADHATKPGEVPSVGKLPTIIGIESTAGEVAQNTATRCELCDHWRRDDYEKHLAAIADTADGQRAIDALRGALLGEIPASEIDGHTFVEVNLAIRQHFGICAAYTEASGEVSITPFYGGCAEGEPYFKMRDANARRIASAGYDKILRMAQGRKE